MRVRWVPGRGTAAHSATTVPTITSTIIGSTNQCGPTVNFVCIAAIVWKAEEKWRRARALDPPPLYLRLGLGGSPGVRNNQRAAAGIAVCSTFAPVLSSPSKPWSLEQQSPLLACPRGTGRRRHTASLIHHQCTDTSVSVIKSEPCPARTPTALGAGCNRRSCAQVRACTHACMSRLLSHPSSLKEPTQHYDHAEAACHR